MQVHQVPAGVEQPADGYLVDGDKHLVDHRERLPGLPRWQRWAARLRLGLCGHAGAAHLGVACPARRSCRRACLNW
jgi:hypothetical protein